MSTALELCMPGAAELHMPPRHKSGRLGLVTPLLADLQAVISSSHADGEGTVGCLGGHQLPWTAWP